jgi:RND superfamily putative drug exporter
MVLLGNAHWWLPRWLDRILPEMDLEGTETLEAVQTPTREREERTV